MKPTSDFDPAQYQWKPQPAVAQFINSQLEQAYQAHPWVRSFAARLLSQTGTRIVDWLDHLEVPSSPALTGLGFRPVAGDAEDQRRWHCEAGIFPLLVMVEPVAGDAPRIGLNIESVEDFLQSHASDIQTSEVHGDRGADVRLAAIRLVDGSTVNVVQRHGSQRMEATTTHSAVEIDDVLGAFRGRPRAYGDQPAGFAAAKQLFVAAAAGIGRDYACDLFFQSEREYWQAKNQAAKIQYQRQNVLGLGWANHDHHTYRCSRAGFAPLINFLETAGFECRERFYAGSDAGWGAQVLEHSACGIVIFADVDMSEAEVAGDFAHEGLAAREEKGTVGLWCQLHGDSFLAAGMHHLECQFDFDAARAQLANCGIQTMEPFTDFPYLKQAFTQGELWQLDAGRLRPLVEAGVISEADAARFTSSGALGSHLEILERNDGYKGFNQTGISKIIMKTDPRTADSN